MSALPAEQDGPIAVQTMTVSVNTLRIGNKQVTLSMFKQLPEADIFTSNFQDNLKVQPWGVVRYYWGQYVRRPTGADEDAFHVVFVLSGALHRCYVRPEGASWARGWVNTKAFDRFERVQKVCRVDNFQHSARGHLWDEKDHVIGGCVSTNWRLRHRREYLADLLVREAKIAKGIHETTWKGILNARNNAIDELKSLPQLFIAV